jgi:hypothetical protein
MCGVGGKGSVESMIEYYRRRARQKRLSFRAASILLIALGASLPAVAVFGIYIPVINKDVTLSLMSAGIAFLTALLGHFRWEVGWRSQTEALFALRAEQSAWDAAVVLAKMHPDDDEAIKFLSDAFERFRVRTFEIAREERGKFFKTAQPPGVKSPGT